MKRRTENEILSGTVEEIKFRNEQNGYTVLDLSCGEELFTAVGVFSDLSAGEAVKLSGFWTYHSTFGRQFRVETCEHSMPATAEQLYNYLAAGAVKGVGPATAARIIETFGEEAFGVLEHDPERLAKIRGISRNKAEKICEDYRRQFAVRGIMMSLEEYGMTPGECLAACKALGSAAAQRVSENPYQLCGLAEGFSFARAEAIAAGLPSPPEESCRLAAGVEYVVRHNLYSVGHTCLPREKLLKTAADFLSVGEDTIGVFTDRLCREGRLVSRTFGGREFIFLASAFRDEKTISDKIKILLRFPPAQRETLDREIEQIQEADLIRYAEKQKLAIRTAVSKGLLILTGGPGTGKTTALRGILRLFKNQGLEVALAAPTGRAARRMTELTGYEARTIHRLLEVEWDEREKPVFKRDLRNPLDCDALILDELSMVDVHLFACLLNAVPFGCRLIMLGDADQLPPVGAGNVLHDLVASGLLPVVELKEVFRQSRDSLIVTNAHRILEGEPLVTSKKDGDFFLLERFSPAAAEQTVVELCCRRLPGAYGYSPTEDIQVLCPSKKGEVGTANLNRVLQGLLNPPDENKKELLAGFRLYREGDRVMQVKNNYHLPWESETEAGEGIFNGDIGRIEKIKPEEGSVGVRFDDRTAVYAREQLAELELAYAVTVHKSQGSEFRAVVLPIIHTIPQLAYRNLLYTAVTRAKELLVIVGSESEVRAMAANDKKTRRYSALKGMLLEEEA